MAQASFIIAAIDKTRAAFVSVRAGLQNITGASGTAQKNIFGLGLKMAGLGTLAVGLKGSFSRLSADIENVKGLDPEVAESFQHLNAIATTSRNVLDEVVAKTVYGYDNLYKVLRYKAIEAYSGLAAAEADANEMARESLETNRQATGYYEKEATAVRALYNAKNALKDVGLGDVAAMTASIARRRQEAEILMSSAKNQTDNIKAVNKEAEAITLRTGALKDENSLREKIDASQKALDKARRGASEIGSTTGESIKLKEKDYVAMLVQARGMTDVIEKNKLMTAAWEIRADVARDTTSIQNEMTASQLASSEAEADVSRIWQTSTVSLKQLNSERAVTLKLLGALGQEYLKTGGDPTVTEKIIKANKKLVEIDKDRLTIMRKNRDLSYEVGNAIASSFENAIFTGGKLRDVLRGLAQDILRLVFRNMVTEGLAAGISTGLRSIFGGGLAAGGPIGTSQTKLVGENGPELFTPSTAGRIIPNHQLNQGASGGSIFYIDATGADRAGMSRLEMMIKALNGSIEYRAVAAVANRRVRGGAGAALA